jgi:hypothetical protein
MGTPNNALQTAIYTRLTGFSALTSLLGSSKIYDHVPQGATPPYVSIGDDTAVDWSMSTTNGWSTTLTIHCWDFETAGRKSVKTILSAIYDALHRQEASITVTGFNLVMIQSEFETTIQDESTPGATDHLYHGIARYRALIHA